MNGCIHHIRMAPQTRGIDSFMRTDMEKTQYTTNTKRN